MVEGLEYSKNGAELRKIQKELVDTILTKPDELEKIINIQLAGNENQSLNEIGNEIQSQNEHGLEMKNHLEMNNGNEPLK